MLSKGEVESLLDYDPLTGLFRWKHAVSSRAKMGSVAGTLDRDGYVVIRIKGRGYKAHRLARLLLSGSWPEDEVDHINRVRSDNRACNLRDVSAFENSTNTDFSHSLGRSGVRNVTWFSQYQMWKAAFMHRGKKIFVGYFETVEAASMAVCKARRSLV